MKKPRRLKFDLQTNDPKKVIEVSVRYCNDDTIGKNGYWTSIMPVELDGFFRTTVAYSGVKAFIKPANRFSQKELERLKDQAYDQIVEHKDDEKCDIGWMDILNRAMENQELELV